MKLISLVFVIILSGCSILPHKIDGPIGSTATFAACKTLDVVTTKIALNSGRFFEGNKLLSLLIGPHNITPLVIVSIGMYLILNHVDDTRVTTFANVVTCGVAIHNTLLLQNAGMLH